MDESEFSHFVEEILPGLIRYVTRIAGPNDAEDICSETLSSLWAKGLDPPGDENARSNLIALTFQIAKGHVRNQQRAARRKMALFDRVRSLGEPIDASSAEILANMLLTEETIATISPLAREDQLLIALVVDDFTRDEIAAILECSTDAVKMRLMRARKKLAAIREDQKAGDDAYRTRQ